MLFGACIIALGCGEAASSPLHPTVVPKRYLGPCDDGSEACTPPGDSTPPAPDYVEESECAECTGVPAAWDTRAIVDLIPGGDVKGTAAMSYFGNSYVVAMSVEGQKDGQLFSTPTVSNEYTSGVAPSNGFAQSPVARVSTFQSCGLVATGTGTFKAIIANPTNNVTWRSTSRTIQSPQVFQEPCPGDPPRYIDKAKSGGVKDGMKQTDQVCWDRFFVSGDSRTYMYTWCE